MQKYLNINDNSGFKLCEMEISLCEAKRQHQLKIFPILSRNLVAYFSKGNCIEYIFRYFGYSTVVFSVPGVRKHIL